jgi:hypothetical protein
MRKIQEDMGGIILSREFFLSCHLTSILSDMRSPDIRADLFTTTFSPYLLRFFTVYYALFQNSFVQKGTYRD